uniref:Alternative protein n=1 Tax=Mesocestoides corti TaxID=53468 RepID=A0A5K3FZK2_MESCO
MHPTPTHPASQPGPMHRPPSGALGPSSSTSSRSHLPHCLSMPSNFTLQPTLLRSLLLSLSATTKRLKLP